MGTQRAAKLWDGATSMSPRAWAPRGTDLGTRTWVVMRDGTNPMDHTAQGMFLLKVTTKGVGWVLSPSSAPAPGVCRAEDVPRAAMAVFVPMGTPRGLREKGPLVPSPTALSRKQAQVQPHVHPPAEGCSGCGGAPLLSDGAELGGQVPTSPGVGVGQGAPQRSAVRPLQPFPRGRPSLGFFRIVLEVLENFADCLDGFN